MVLTIKNKIHYPVNYPAENEIFKLNKLNKYKTLN